MLSGRWNWTTSATQHPSRAAAAKEECLNLAWGAVRDSPLDDVALQLMFAVFIIF